VQHYDEAFMYEEWCCPLRPGSHAAILPKVYTPGSPAF
jgi:hypothetical protein